MGAKATVEDIIASLDDAEVLAFVVWLRETACEAATMRPNGDGSYALTYTVRQVFHERVTPDAVLRWLRATHDPRV